MTIDIQQTNDITTGQEKSKNIHVADYGVTIKEQYSQTKLNS